MKIRTLGISAAAICLISCLAAQAESSNYLAPKKVELLRILPPPPPLDSKAQQRDMQAVLDAQKERTPQKTERALADNILSIYRFDDVLGPNFNPTNLPLTDKFFGRMHADARAILNATKETWVRLRPYKINSDVTMLGDPPRTFYAYPSGTTIFGTLSGIILANMVPEKSFELHERSAEYVANRVILGVHYPSDVHASQMGATALAAAFFDTPSFVIAYEESRRELRQVLGFK
jgi:acid phosphatase (class A)